jgi:hypothetical protein
MSDFWDFVVGKFLEFEPNTKAAVKKEILQWILKTAASSELCIELHKSGADTGDCQAFARPIACAKN